MHLHRVMQWASILGFGLIISGQYFSNLPYSLYPATDFWINSPGLIFIKLGVILVLAGAHVSVDAPRRRPGMELGAAAGHHVAARLLGPYRARVWTLVRLLEGRSLSHRRVRSCGALL